MVQIGTLAKVMVALSFPCVGIAYYTQHKVKNAFSERGWYKESVDLLKGYKPAMERLGEPVTFYKIDVSDGFNYQDAELARARIPVKGQKASANLLVYAKCHSQGAVCDIDYLELEYGKQRYKFFDGNLAKPSN